MKQFVNLSMLLLIVVIISGCIDVKEQNKDKVEENHEIVDEDYQSPHGRYQFSHNSQVFEIIYFFEEVLEYTSRMEGNSLEQNQEDIYMESVLKPFNEQSLLDITLDNSILLSPSWRIKELKENTIELIENQKRINKWIEEALLKSAELLPGKDTKIYIFPVNPEDWFTIYNMNGVGGVAYSESDFILFIDPSFTEESLKYTVTHEYHHIVNFLHNGEQSINSILDLIIIEGKADSFATILYPEIKVSWIEPLAEKEEVAILDELYKNINSSNLDNYDKFVEGNYAQGIPMWSNYKIGYQMTQSFIEKNPETSIEEWTKLDAKEIVKGSKYSHLLQ